MGDAIRSGYQNYANFQGRAAVGEYWWWVLYNLIVGVVLAVATGVSDAGLVLWFLWGLAHFIPSFALGIRRLHDSGKSGAYLLWSVFPLVGSIIVFVFLVQSSDHGWNAYGEPSTT